MIQKIKKPVSILLTVLMVFSVFAVVPFTASAATYDSGIVDLSDLQVGDIITADVSKVEIGGCTVVLKGGRYGQGEAYEGELYGPCPNDRESSSIIINLTNGNFEIIDKNGWDFFVPVDQNSELANKLIVLAKEGNKITIGGYSEADTPEPLNSSVKYRYYDGGYFRNGNTPADNTYKVVSGNKKWTDGNWYVVTEDVTISDRITTSGTVNLVLCDGAKLNAKKGISVNGNCDDPNQNATLNIYSQSGGTGTLFAGTIDGTNTTMPENPENAAIGGNSYHQSGSITIHGGNITAIAYKGAAGIGGGRNNPCSTVTVYGGNVTAGCTGGFGSGIGGGYYAEDGSVNVAGGHVIAYGLGGEQAAAIGNMSENINLTVADGSVIKAGSSASDAAVVASASDALKKVYVEINAPALPQAYDITWKMDDGSPIDTTTVKSGVVPTHADPTKTADDTNTYTFSGWTPAVVAVTGDATYTAKFTATPYVASVTDGGTVTYYSSLKEAINAAPNGSTVTLHKDVTEEQTAYANNNNTYGGNGNVISGKTITITSNGTGSDRKTVTGSRFDVINGGNVTFTNIIIDGGVADSANKIIINNDSSFSHYFMAVSYGSTLTFDTGATVQNYYAAAHGVIDVGNGRRGSLDPSNVSSTINIKDGSEFKNLGANYGVFREDYKSTINMSGGSVKNCASFRDEGVLAYVAQGSVFNMTGGEITGCSPEGTAPGLIFLHAAQGNGNNKFTMTGGTISGNTAKLGGAVYSANVNNTVTVGGSAVATGNTGTNINNGQSGSSNFYLAAGQTMTIESDNHLSGDSLIGIYSATAPTDSADVKIATGAVKEDIQHIHSDLPGNAGIIYCDGEKDWIWYNNQFVEVSCHHTSHQSGTVWLSTAVNTYEVTFDTDGGTPATIPAQTVVSNSKATKPADPTKDSYMFDGWYNGDTEFNFDTPITANTNLKAKWSVPVASVTSNGTTTNYTDFGTAVSKWTDGSKLTLLADVTMNGTITVSGTRTLDLNGYGITKSNQGRLFNIDGNLTINDSNPTRSTHKYTVDGTGLAVLDDNGTQSFQGGYITGGHGYTTSGEYGWGGFAIVDLGHKNQNYSLTINGGTIIGNKTDLGGGGVVRVNSNGIFTMNGGAIIYNTTATDPASPNNDGAVSGEPNVQFYIRGGTIAHNTTKGGVTSDLYLANNQKVIVDEELDSATSIGIKMQNGTGVFTDSADTNLNDADKFFSDDSAYGVLKNTDGQLELKNVYTVTWNNWDGTELEKDENVFKDTTPTFDGDTPTKPADNQYRYTFSGWTPALAPVTADITYTAQFTEKPKTLISGHSLTLDGDIGINFYIDPSVAGMTVEQADSQLSYTLEWEKPGVAKKPLTVLGKAISEDGKSIIVTCKVCAAEMTCGIKASFSLGTKTENEVYSVRKYCDEGILANNAPYRDNEKLYDLANAMLDYGAKAQKVFGVKTDDLANEGLKYTMPTGTPDFDKAVSDANNNAKSNISEAQISGGSFKFATLVFLSDSTLRLYFENTGGLPTGSMTKWNDYYYMQKTDIPAKELDKLQQFDVNGTTLTYSALDYAKGLTSLGNDDYTALACALYYYNQAANEYFG